MTMMNNVETDEEILTEVGRETELQEISGELKALMSLLFALGDAEEGGYVVDSSSLFHLGRVAAECDQRLNCLFPEIGET